MFGGVGWTLADRPSIKLSVKPISSIGRSSRSTEARGGSGASSLIRLSKASRSDFSADAGAAVTDPAPFWIVLARLGRLGSEGDTAMVSGREKERVDRSELGRAVVLEEGLEAMGLLLKLASMVVSRVRVRLV
jgi:hypothetical protein